MAFDALVDVETPVEATADDKAQDIPDKDGRRSLAWSTFVLHNSSADSDFDAVEDSPNDRGVVPVGKDFDDCEVLDDGSNAG